MIDNKTAHAAHNGRTPTHCGAGPTAARHVQRAEQVALDLPLIGTLRLPRPEQLAYYGAVGLLVALEVVDWPVAALIAAGHALATQQHSRVIQEFGEALQDAD